jgi:hypothetical protein
MRRLLLVPLFATLLILMVLSACVFGKGSTSTNSAAAVYTSAAQTAAAQLTSIDTASPTRPSATFGPTSTSTATPSPAPTGSPTQKYLFTATAGGCDNSVYMADVTYPDNTVVAPSTVFNKTWSIKNTGTCTWSEEYSLVFISGSAMGGGTTYLTAAVAPGGTVSITVPMTSPAENGTYTGYWRMMNASAVRFGASVTVVIKVSAGVTSTPTPTATGATVTPAPTTAATHTFTATVPTDTPAPTPTSTPTPEPSATTP